MFKWIKSFVDYIVTHTRPVFVECSIDNTNSSWSGGGGEFSGGGASDSWSDSNDSDWSSGSDD